MMRKVKGIFITAGVAIGVLMAPHGLAEGDPEAGEGMTQACVACHATDGNSPVAMYPKLAGLGERYLLEQMQAIRDGDRPVPEMTGMLEGMSDQDLADIAAFYDAQEREIAGAGEEDLELGEKIYRGGIFEIGVAACTGCHSPTGAGNAPAGYPAIGGQYADYIASQLRAFRAAAHEPEHPDGRSTDGDSREMRDITARMSDREINAVANFIAGLK